MSATENKRSVSMMENYITKSSLKSLVVLGVALALTTSPANAASDNKVTSIGDWSLVCFKDRVSVNKNSPPCEIVQVVRPAERDEPALRLAYAYSGRRDIYGMHLTLPKDMRSSAGVVIRLDDALNLQYQVSNCPSTRCYSEATLGTEEMKKLLGANKGLVAIVGANDQLRRIPLSFIGFREALAEMVDRNKK